MAREALKLHIGRVGTVETRPARLLEFGLVTVVARPAPLPRGAVGRAVHPALAFDSARRAIVVGAVEAGRTQVAVLQARSTGLVPEGPLGTGHGQQVGGDVRAVMSHRTGHCLVVAESCGTEESGDALGTREMVGRNDND